MTSPPIVALSMLVFPNRSRASWPSVAGCALVPEGAWIQIEGSAAGHCVHRESCFRPDGRTCLRRKTALAGSGCFRCLTGGNDPCRREVAAVRRASTGVAAEISTHCWKSGIRAGAVRSDSGKLAKIPPGSSDHTGRTGPKMPDGVTASNRGVMPAAANALSLPLLSGCRGVRWPQAGRQSHRAAGFASG